MNLFVGRVAEQERFLDVLQRASAQSAAEPEVGFVVLVHGHGGSGKTRLLERYRKIAAGEPGGTRFVVATVDWEQERRLHRSDFPGTAGPPVWRVLDRLYRAVVDAMSTSSRGRRLAERAFYQFRKRMTWLPDLMERARQLGLDAVLGRQHLSAEDCAALTEAAARLAGAGLASAGGGTSAALGRLAVTTSVKVKTYWSGHAEPEAYASLTSELDDLVRTFAAGLLFLSRKGRPVVLILDTCEVLGDAGDWLSEVINRAGAGTVWVVGLRYEASVGPLEDGVLARFRAAAQHQRLVTVPLVPFGEQDLRDYLHGVFGECLPDGVTIEQIACRTRGLPLAIFLVVTFLQRGHPPHEVFSDSAVDGSARQIVRALVERHLIHLRSVPELASDLPLIQGLALLAKEQVDPGLLGVLWDVPTVDVADRLDQLARRHDFVLSTSRLVHGDVADAILHYLLGPAEREAVRPANERAIAYLQARLAGESPGDIEGQLADEAWHRDSALLLWHTYWADPRRGYCLLCHLFPAVAVMSPALAAELTMIGSYFRSLHSAAEQRNLDGLVYLAARPFLPPQHGDVNFDLSTVLNTLMTTSTTEPVLSDSVPSDVFVNMLAAMNGDLFGIDLDQRVSRVEQAAQRIPDASVITPKSVETLAVRLAYWITVRHMEDDESVTRELSLRASMTAVTVAPSSASAHACLGMLLAQQERWKEAESALREANRLDPSISRNDILGYVLRELGRHEEAVTVLRDVLRDHPDLSHARIDLALSLLMSQTQENMEEAIDHFRTAIRLGSNDFKAHLGLGQALIFVGRYGAAETSLRRALEIRRDAVALRYLGLALAQQGRAEEAEPLHREAVAVDPDRADAHLELGVVLGVQGRHDEAVTEFREAIRLKPRLRLAHENLGIALFASGQHAEGNVAMREAERLKVANEDVPVTEIGVMGGFAAVRTYQDPIHAGLPARPDSAAALEEFVDELYECIRSNPEDSSAHSLLGTFLINLHQFAKAEPILLKAIGLDPEDHFAYVHLGLARCRLGRYEEAVTPLQEAIRLAPDDPNVLALAGALLGELGYDEESVRLVSKAIALSPGSCDMHVNLAFSLRQMGRFSDAERELHKARQLNDNDFGIHTNLGEIYLFLDDHAKALNSLRRAIELNARASMKAHALLGVLLRSSDPSAARAAFRTALATFEPYQSKFATAETRAIAMVALGEADAASRLLRSALSYRVSSDTFRKPIYDLLNQPQLVGVEQLLAVWDTIITGDPAAARPFYRSAG